MDHEEAARDMAVEKYLLNEMTATARDRFEQHFFECQECAADLRAASAFLDESRTQLGWVQRRPAAKPVRQSRITAWFRPAFVSPVLAAMLLVIVYQSFTDKGARLEAPEVLTSASLVSGNSRGGEVAPLAVADGMPVLLSVDVPTQDQYSSYELALMSPAGATLWRVPISIAQARDTVSVRVPTQQWASGEYRLIVYGRSISAPDPKDLAHYRFSFSNHPNADTKR